MIKTKIKQNWKLSLFYATHVFVVLALMIYSCFFHKVQKFDSARWAYFFIVLLTFAVIATWSVLYIKKDEHNQLFKRLMVCVVVLVAFLFTILLMDYKSGDYLAYLKIWFDAYKEGSLKDALYVIVDVSNYTPAYNYFCLYLQGLD